MSYEFYKILHQVGLFMIFLSLGAILLNGLQGGSKQYPGRRLVMITHGLGMFITLVAGFGLLARLGLGFPTWAIAKLGIWLVLGASLVVARRAQSAVPALWGGVLILAGVAAYIARNKSLDFFG